MILVLTEFKGKCSCCGSKWVEPEPNKAQKLNIESDLWYKEGSKMYCPDCWQFDEYGFPELEKRVHKCKCIRFVGTDNNNKWYSNGCKLHPDEQKQA